MTPAAEEYVSDAGRALLASILAYFRSRQAWPTLRSIDRPLRRQGVPDCLEIVRQLPEHLIRGTRIEQPYLDDEVKLTVAGIVTVEPDAAEILMLLRMLAPMADLEELFDDCGDRNLRPVFSSDDARKILPDATNEELVRLFMLFRDERFGNEGWSGPDEHGEWAVTLGREVALLRDVCSLENYLTVTAARHAKLVAEQRRALAPDPRIGEDPTPALRENSYIDAAVFARLSVAADDSTWYAASLVQLVSEIESSVVNDNWCAAIVLLRALLNHVPPLFGKTRFEQVVSNVSWERSDVKYIEHLATFRAHADDIHHRQISKKPVIFFSVADLPPARSVAILLSKCAEMLVGESG